MIIRKLNCLFILALLLRPGFCDEKLTTKDAIDFFQHGDRIDILAGEKLITSYWSMSGSKPILWPLKSPKGFALTRDYPMSGDNPNEVKDHLHHRSLWCTHGEVNGINFWAEEGEQLGKVVQTNITMDIESDREAILTTQNEWRDQNDRSILTEDRKIFIRRMATTYELDFDIKLIAGDEAVEFGDTKEGTFGIRVAEQIRVEANKGGRILTSEGIRDDEAWGQASDWVDYSLIGNGQPESSTGITMMVHPESFQYPGRWHVRGYGLFAHNPFGVIDFESVKPLKADARSKGGYSILPNQSIRLRYLVVLHDDDWTPESCQQRYLEFAK